MDEKKTKMEGVTPFQRRVYMALQSVPVGRVTTYKLLAKALGIQSPRAVGQALRLNPFAPEVPCHRVISSDFSIGGYSGERYGAQVEKKRQLLATEGVVFGDGRLADIERLFTPFL